MYSNIDQIVTQIFKQKSQTSLQSAPVFVIVMKRLSWWWKIWDSNLPFGWNWIDVNAKFDPVSPLRLTEGSHTFLQFCTCIYPHLSPYFTFSRVIIPPCNQT